jgi:hypothetical protein
MRSLLLAALLVLPGLASPVRGDEGMWTFNGFPFERFEKAYGFQPSPELLDHLRLSSVRHGGGGSASFVSADGLVITNHHVGAGCSGPLDRPRNIMQDGLPPRLDQEILARRSRSTCSRDRAGHRKVRAV